jgi:hypothetical protein
MDRRPVDVEQLPCEVGNEGGSLVIVFKSGQVQDRADAAETSRSATAAPEAGARGRS